MGKVEFCFVAGKPLLRMVCAGEGAEITYVTCSEEDFYGV